MEMGKRMSLVLAIFLIGLGVLLLAFSFVPGWKAEITWPVIFFVLAAGFFIPPLVFPHLRTGLAALFIPGMALATMGMIFLYNVLTEDWAAWAYAWLLMSAGGGAGLALAGWYGRWGKPPVLAGIWILVTSAALFSIFGFIFGGPAMKTIAAVLLILSGLALVLRAIARP